ncbi:MAG: hypothetical protein JSW63_03110 [Ignavibacterium sp.]|nr:MAG: hypothetical protein JSW63_03110 [Ignavibacterium sp.]
MIVVFEFDISYNQLTVNNEAIERALGYNSRAMPTHFRDVLDDLMQESKKHLEIKGGFNLIQNNVSVIGKLKLIINHTELITENIITTQLQKIEGSALFACTLGKRFDEWCRSFDNHNDIFHHYFADAIGSEIIESAVDWLEEQINIEAEKFELNCTNRYSPGYCDWNVSDQHNLFSFFPVNFCDIEVTESALMTPIKSVSGIIGLGKNVRKKAYTCNICSMENCYLRVREFG